MIKTYILTFLVSNARMPDLEGFIKYDPAILAYWNHIPLVYCLKTQLTAVELRMRLEPIFPQGGFMVAEINSGNIDGRLPSEAWTWFYADPKLKSGLGILGNALTNPPKGGLGIFGESGLFGSQLPKK